MDLISRQAAIDAIEQHKTAVLGKDEYDEGIALGYAAAHRHLVDIVKQLPTADLSEYSDKLWKTAYERGKAETHPNKGKWIHRKHWSRYVCEQCSFESREASRYCPDCGAKMEG